jgi:hypothetical protein
LDAAATGFKSALFFDDLVTKLSEVLLSVVAEVLTMCCFSANEIAGQKISPVLMKVL